ncbi:MAG: chromosomal replication initiator protein DnaA [Lachnospiraceae bacterium]|uniref:chromosomal replication initiator protein DnaA n=1 Tax=Roseburia hominis TaxID=301301 RepID=UPI001F1987DB|nr:chromosomal replication initiator protein DnaA [Roseburia hominis]MCI5712322.1 chromosomal replication initiator protein DnaA [Lachnospiraceae bacterium]MDY4840178.1 chromosomal replication initiator protein DnaA [Lachnospiraceae bacterium]
MDKILEKWDKILQEVKEEYEMTDVSFNTWLKPLTVSEVNNDKLYILVPLEKMARDFIEKKYMLPIKVAVVNQTGKDYDIEFILPEQEKKIKSSYHTATAQTVSDNISDSLNLNPNYTFDTFVVGNNNRMAQAASLAVAENPGEVYNPLFLYGGVGLGKTHLMHSIAHFIHSNRPDAKILYVSSETFTNELIDAIRNGKNNNGGNTAALSKFREKYRNIDVLLIDDIQFIIGKESTQEEFFHTFNELRDARKQIVISSDKPPKDMETLEERIRSRFEWGLTADIGSPDYETRMAILKRKAEMDNFELDDEIFSYIANNIKSNIRELEGALNKLMAFSNLVQMPITMDLAVKELQNVISPDKPNEITPQLVLDVVCEHFQVSLDQLKSKSRSSNIARPRQIAMYLCKNMTDISLDGIGELLGGRDHSTVIHGVNKITEEYENTEATRSLIDTIKKKINPN